MGAFGCAAVTGKPVGDDLREGKPTMLLAYGRELTSGADASLLQQVGQPDVDEATLSQVRDVLERCARGASSSDGSTISPWQPLPRWTASRSTERRATG
jgi:geranylgeranyl diphosphate synthase type I